MTPMEFSESKSIMFNPSKILRYPLRSIKYVSKAIYANSPEKREEGLKLGARWYEENKEALERREIENLEIR